MLLRCYGWRRRKSEHHTLSYAHVLDHADSESIEATVRRRRIFLAGFVARVEERLQRTVVFGEIVGGKG